MHFGECEGHDVPCEAGGVGGDGKYNGPRCPQALMRSGMRRQVSMNLMRVRIGLN